MSNSTATRQPPEQPSGQPSLVRAMGPKLLLLFIVGDILGTGVYSLTGKVAGEVGGAVWVPFLGAFLVAFFTAFSYLELVGKFPKAAGAALYTNRAFKVPFITFIVAFAVMSSGLTSASSAARAFGGDYLTSIVPIPGWIFAVSFLLIVALVNLRGVTESIRLNMVLTLIELSGLLVIIVIGLVTVASGNADFSRVTDFNTEGQSAFGAVTAATALAFFAMVGFEDSVNMAEETKNPTRTFPRVMLTGLAITGLIYVLVSLTATVLVPTSELAESTGPLLLVVQAGAPWFPLELFSVIALIAVSNSALINMMMASRLVYGMAGERIIPGPFARVHPRRRTPWVAILFTSAIGLVLVLTSDLEALGSTTSLLLLVVFTVVNVACLVLRRDPVEHKHFRAPTVVPIIGAVLCGFLASPFSGRDPRDYLIAGVLLLVGLAFWVLNRLVVGKVSFDPQELK